jgi:hypothetical protein
LLLMLSIWISPERTKRAVFGYCTVLLHGGSE